MQLPEDITPENFNSRYRLDFAAWMGAIEEVCSQHGFASRDLKPFTDGSNLIASVTDRYVIKIFPPFHRHQWESEWRVLRRLGEHGLSIPIPKLLAQGERDDHWPYVVLSRLPGVTLEGIWPKLSQGEKTRLMTEIGRIMAQVHSVPVGDLHDLEPEWAPFLKMQVERCKSRHKRLGMPDWFLAEVERYVADRIDSVAIEAPVILTGEYTPFNLLVSQVGDHWSITGMIDFGDAMMGHREYDFLGPCLFLGEGNPDLIDALFSAYGYASPRMDDALRSRLMLLALLHRYSDLRNQIKIDAWQSRVKTLQELERLVFAY
ncbi:MAG: phosphotransferase [Methylotenera sp.]|nr:phosphotransferase [Oligoflexia bacterium]